MRRAHVGAATLAQLKDLEHLFPNLGAARQTRPLRAGNPASYHDDRQITDPRETVVRLHRPPSANRQIVGAYADEAGASGDFRELGLPLSPVAGVSIAAGATADFELKPSKLFLPGILSMDSTLAALLLMTNLTIGGNPCFLSTGAVPCAAFSNLTVHKPFKGWSASNAQPITFTLKNIHASVAQIVWGVWWGVAEV